MLPLSKATPVPDEGERDGGDDEDEVEHGGRHLLLPTRVPSVRVPSRGSPGWFERVLRSAPMMKGLLGLAALLALWGCSAVATVKVTPLRDQSASQIEADRTRCNEWAQGTAVVSAGYAACMISAGYEAPPGVRSTSQSVRLGRTPTPNDPIGILIDFLECDREARREAESGLGTVGKAIRDFVGWSANADRRRQVFVDCLKPRGYNIGKS